MDFAIETLAGQSGRDVFDCGDSEMNEWLQTVASQSDRRNQTLTRVALHPEDGRIVGYYSQKAYQLQGDDLREALGPDVRYPVPCVLLARLARCLSVRHEGVGELLLTHALRACVRVSEEIGVQFVVVHALTPQVVDFYEAYGFEPFVDHPQHLLLPVRTLKKLFAL